MPSQPEGLQPLLDAHWAEVCSLFMAITRHRTTAECIQGRAEGEGARPPQGDRGGAWAEKHGES
jgi:hypothetical protein